MLKTQKEIIKKFNERLNSQRRVFSFDERQILILPFLEHNKTKESSEKIKFYISKNGDSLNTEKVKKLKIEEDKTITIFSQKESYKLHQQKMNGNFEEVILKQRDFSELTIDHSPSIQIVLYTMYINEEEDFYILSDFCESVSDVRLNSSNVKIGGFKGKVEKILNASKEKEKIINAYKKLFNKIKLEVKPSENNNANLTFESLKYFQNNIEK